MIRIVVRRAALALLLLALAGCSRTMANIYIENQSGGVVESIQFTFPKATRGTQQLAEGAKVHHVVKFTDSGSLRITFRDAAGQERSSEGPEVQENFGGDVRVVILPMEVRWEK